MATNVLGFDIPFNVPSLGLGSGWIVILGSIFLFFLAGAVTIWLIYNWRLYNKKIIVFENIAGQGYQPTFRDRARVVKLGDGGEEILWLRKKKVYRSAYGKKMGTNTYWFCVGQDGYWYNVVLGDIDAKMGMLDIEPIDRDMRYAHVAIRKNITERYRKIKFMEKYGTLVIGGIALMIVGGALFFIVDQIAEISGSIAGAVDAATKVQEASRDIISSLDNICTGGSGITPA